MSRSARGGAARVHVAFNTLAAQALAGPGAAPDRSSFREVHAWSFLIPLAASVLIALATVREEVG